MIFFDSAFLLRIRSKHDEGGVAAVSVRFGMVSKDGTSDSENIGALSAVLRRKKLVDEVVVFPTLRSVNAGENFLFVAKFGGEGIVGFALPAVFSELFHDLISVHLILETTDCRL